MGYGSLPIIVESFVFVMNSMLSLFFLSCLALAAYAAPAPGVPGAIITGPSGVVTPYGPIGPYDHGLGHGLGYGIGHGFAGAPAAYGHGLGLGYGGYGGYSGYGGHGGYGGYGPIGGHIGTVITPGGGVVGVSHHGVSVKGPETVPAIVSGPSGKIVAEGLYGVQTHPHW